MKTCMSKCWSLFGVKSMDKYFYVFHNSSFIHSGTILFYFFILCQPLAIKMKFTSKNIIKFPESFWKFSYYFITYMYACYLLFGKGYEYFKSPRTCWTGIDHSMIIRSIWGCSLQFVPLIVLQHIYLAMSTISISQQLLNLQLTVITGHTIHHIPNLCCVALQCLAVPRLP